MTLPEIRPGYKVVDRNYYSSSTPYPEAVKYKLERWTKPNPGCGPLAVFEKRYQAINFIKEEKVSKNWFRIYRCFYVPSLRNCLHTKIDFKSKNYYESPKRFLSEGTLFADAVYLYKRCHL